MLSIMEQNFASAHKENYPMGDPQHVVNLEVLVQRWRKKVYELLVDKKRYEIIMRDNIKNYTQDKDKILKDLKQS